MATGGLPLPPVSLIVPTRNRPAILTEAIDSILAGTELPAELIIVDQSDTVHPELPRLAAGPVCTVRYLWSRSKGLSHARNEGIAAAAHDIFAFTDDDVLVARSWLGTLVRALVAAGNESVVTGQVQPAEQKPGGFVPSTMVEPHPAVYRGRIGADVLYPHNMAFHRTLVDRIGLFDVRLGAGARFAGAEDNDFAFRLLEAGHRIVYVPEAVVHHRAWRSNHAYLPLRWSYGRGQGAFYAKHMRLHDRYMLWRLGQDIGQRTLRFARLLPRQPRRAVGQLVCAAGVIAGAAEWLITRPEAA